MLPTTVLAVTSGAWLTLGLIAAFGLVGLIALLRTPDVKARAHAGVRYVFGLGKHPRLVHVPGNRDVPATPEPLGGKGLRSLAADAGAKSRFTTERYRLEDGRTAPYELSEDIPETITEIELAHEDARVWIGRDGELDASRRLTEAELSDLEVLLQGVQGESAVRADRRTWSPGAHSAADANRERA